MNVQKPMQDTSALPETHFVNGMMLNKDLTARPAMIDNCDTMPKLFALRCKNNGQRTAHREKDFGIWKAYSWADFWAATSQIGAALKSLGLNRGEVVSILSEDNKEWAYFDLGIQGIGGICSGVYTTDSAAQLAYLLQDSESVFLIVENDEQLDKFLKIRDQVPLVKKVIVLDPEGLHDIDDAQIIFLDQFYEIGRDALKQQADLFENAIMRGAAEDTAMLIYTSGTTGKPKGAMITNENVMAATACGSVALPHLSTDEQLCFLPLGHVFERGTSISGSIAASTIVNFAESPETVFDNLREVSPHIFAAVPRVWEKIYSAVIILAKEATPLGQWAFKCAIKVGMAKAELIYASKPIGLWLRAKYVFWDALVLRNLRIMLGLDRIRRAVSGAAPVSPELLKWYLAIGVPIREGYGMTENTAVCSVNTPDATRLGSVGKASAGTQARISDAGEIQTNGLTTFAGYWKNPQKTAETFTADGWLKTGDLGVIDKDGFLTVTGRIKDIIITSGGKNITPAELESELKFSHYIADAVVIGDGRKYLTALIMIDQENVEKFAQEQKIPFSDFASLCQAELVTNLVGVEIERVNQNFARVEQIKKFKLIDILLTAEDDELTATMKLKRGFVEKKFSNLIDEMYT
ncbi:MAG: long-chain fatty acid--CoA ligase [Rhizobiales bacterium]|nr:long-chain fatty acid--CoA ligase [Hyphomicrobiales bacterium]NRB13273.1 long-chain fatty acid--CoA ligase [Hyphomicrobiales bacterium]